MLFRFLVNGKTFKERAIPIPLTENHYTMTDRNDFIKIRTYILIDPSRHLIYEDGKLHWNSEYLEDFYDADAKFREPIIFEINEQVGQHNWAIRFQQFYTGEFEAYIYCETEEDFLKIVAIIKEKINEEFRLIKRNGTVDDYIDNR